MSFVIFFGLVFGFFLVVGAFGWVVDEFIKLVSTEKPLPKMGKKGGPV